MIYAIRNITVEDVEQFHQALDAVAKEKKFLLDLEAPSKEKIRDIIKISIGKGYPFVVAELDGQIIGWADLTPYQRESNKHVSHLGMGVVKKHRGKGIGGLMLGEVVQKAIDLGCLRLELEVFADNLSAISLYEKHGFELEGIKRKAACIGGKFVDVNIMGKIVA